MGEHLHCPHCDYDLTGLPDVETCPECGREITADDRRYQLRRQIFLELTRFTPWWRLGVLVLIGLIGYAWPLLFLVPGLIVAAVWFTGNAARDAAQHRLVRRLWMINLCWLQLPWVTAVLGRVAIEAFAWSPLDIFALGDRWFSNLDDFQFRVYLALACVGAAMAVPIWRWRWRANARSAGATAASADAGQYGLGSRGRKGHIGLRIALRICLWPMFLPLLVIVVSWAVMKAADLFSPGWG